MAMFPGEMYILSVSTDRTNASLLRRVRDPDDRASWREFYGLYAPLLARYARQRGLTQADAEDVAQECMQALAKAMPGFDYRPSRGRFKGYLRTLANNKIVNLVRRKRPRLAQSGELVALVDSDAQSAEAWESTWTREHLAFCLKRVETRFAPETVAAFKHHVLDEWPVEKVSAALNLSANQVYLAKSRVTRRLRQEMTRLVGERA
jgi:RNA polymerase sigma-70 factor (ECF subfamily)